MEKKLKKLDPIWPCRLRGGADSEKSDISTIAQALKNLDESISPMVTKAIANAEFHGIHLHQGVKNLANGDCIFESVIDSVNTRDCFEESFDGTPAELRNIWMSIIEKVAFEGWNLGMSVEEWKAGFDKLKQPGVYELTLGDLVPPGIAHCTRKNLLIFNTSPLAVSPIYVIAASTFGGCADTDIPVCLAYDQAHYESLVPSSDADIHKTVNLSQQFLHGRYSLKMEDIQVFRQANQEIIENYDGHFPVLGSATNNIKSSGEQEKVQSFKGKITRSISRQVNLQNIIQGQKRKQTLDTQQGRKHDAGKKKEMMKETMETSCQEKEDKKTYLKQTSVGGTGKLNDEEDCSLSLEQLRLLKANNRTNPQTRRYRKLMRLKKIEE